MEKYSPPYNITSTMIKLVSEISEILGFIKISGKTTQTPKLRKNNQIKSIQASLEIENNTLTLEQVTAVISGKRVLGHPREIKEVQNAFKIYDIIETLNPEMEKDFLKSHGIMMEGLEESAGAYRSGGVGIIKGKDIIHIAPPAERVSYLMKDLFLWLKESDEHPLIKSSVFHYEVEFIHPFIDGNGRMGRLWQTLILSKWKDIFYYLPLESVIRNRQEDYYSVLRISDSHGNSAAFIEFILNAILTVIKDIESDQDDDQVSDQVASVLKAIGEKTLSANEIMVKLGLNHRPNFRNNYLHPALTPGFIEMTNPLKPNSRLQKYRLTETGKNLFNKLNIT